MTSPTKSEKGPLVALYHWVASCKGSLGGAPPASKLVRASSNICIQRGSPSIAFWPTSALFLQESALSSNHRRHRLLTPGLPATGSGTAPIIRSCISRTPSNHRRYVPEGSTCSPWAPAISDHTLLPDSIHWRQSSAGSRPDTAPLSSVKETSSSWLQTTPIADTLLALTAASADRANYTSKRNVCVNGIYQLVSPALRASQPSAFSFSVPASPGCARGAAACGGWGLRWWRGYGTTLPTAEKRRPEGGGGLTSGGQRP